MRLDIAGVVFACWRIIVLTRRGRVLLLMSFRQGGMHTASIKRVEMEDTKLMLFLGSKMWQNQMRKELECIDLGF